MRITLSALTAAAALVCAVVLPGVWGAADQSHDDHLQSTPGLVRQVREATERFKDPAQAIAAGYAPLLGCVSGPQEGAMGLHLVNNELVGDGSLDAARPEALLYEERNGQLRLLGVEYIVLAAAWHEHSEPPPVLAGQLFHHTNTPNRYGLPAFYELHVWAWKDNPNGTFVDWNPKVSCEGFTPEAMAPRH